MNCSLLKTTYPTLTALLLVRLNQTICLQGEVLLKKGLKDQAKAIFGVCDRTVSADTIALKRVKNATAIVYSSPIALQLAPCLHVNPFDLAREITHSLVNVGAVTPHWPDLNEEIMKLIWENLNVTVSPSGCLQFELHDGGLARWLQFWLIHPAQLPDRRGPIDEHAPEVLACQYAHARCSALLRLGHETNLIELSGAPNWCWLAPHPLPSLVGRCWFNQPVERRLLENIVTGIDELFGLPAGSRHWLALTIGLTQAWQACDRAWQILGQTKPEDLAMTQHRLSLIMLTQRLLRSLLEQRLGVVAPFEL